MSCVWFCCRCWNVKVVQERQDLLIIGFLFYRKYNRWVPQCLSTHLKKILLEFFVTEKLQRQRLDFHSLEIPNTLLKSSFLSSFNKSWWALNKNFLLLILSLTQHFQAFLSFVSLEQKLYINSSIQTILAGRFVYNLIRLIITRNNTKII